ncbi:hypothetical protein Mgra_00005488 [Meloidogyne graminicola]|uniref:Uncharacterized protein n=1 Tax=Meloidogyne graminicola TaxID=189291 RepID=A0A8S9ZNF7_9BILA|nr:hypothetical protein Mgra_00005488 [Meloidogyne graminicola]
MNIISLQAILALVIQNKLAEWILSLLSCFAGGVFMGTCFLDIFPHINENYERFILKSKWKIEYPLPQFFVCCGFFLVYLLEELILKIFSSSTLHSGHSHSVGNVSSLNNSTTTHHHKHRRDKTQCNEEHLKTSNTCTNNNDGGNIGIQQQSTTIYIRKADCDESDSINFANQFKQRSISTLTNDYINNVERVDDGLLKSITFAVAMSFHSVLEGFALGVQNLYMDEVLKGRLLVF